MIKTVVNPKLMMMMMKIMMIMMMMMMMMNINKNLIINNMKIRNIQI